MGLIFITIVLLLNSSTWMMDDKINLKWKSVEKTYGQRKIYNTIKDDDTNRF